MAGSLGAAAQAQLDSLQHLENKVMRVYGLVEMFATAKTGQEQYLISMKRGLGELKRQFMLANLAGLSLIAGGLELAAGRGGGINQKIRMLREGVGSLKFNLELEQRAVVEADKKKRAEEEAAEAAKKAAAKARAQAAAARARAAAEAEKQAAGEAPPEK